MHELYQELKNCLDHRQGVALATVVRGPLHLGAKLLVFPDGTSCGSLGLPVLDTRAIEDAQQAIWYPEARVHTYLAEDIPFDVFIEGFPPPPELIIVGASHIAVPLTTIAKALDYHVVIIDARSAFANRERFSYADELIVAWPDEVLQTRPLHPSTAIVVLTHDPKFDESALHVAVSRHCGYIGAIGSRQTSVERAERLKRQGLTDAQLQRIHGPIGLNIGATTPAEVAIAIMAEIVAAYHGKDRAVPFDW